MLSLIVAAVIGQLLQPLAACEQAACERSDAERWEAYSHDSETASFLQTPAHKALQPLRMKQEPAGSNISIPPHHQFAREQVMAAVAQMVKMFPEQADALIAHMDELIHLIIDGGELPSQDPLEAPPHAGAASVGLAQTGGHCSCSKSFQYCWKKKPSKRAGDGWCYTSPNSPAYAPMTCAGTCTLDYGQDPNSRRRGKAAISKTKCIGQLMELISSVVSFVALLGSPADTPVMLLREKVMKTMKTVVLDSVWKSFLHDVRKKRLGVLVEALKGGDMEKATRITKDIYLRMMDLGLLTDVMSMAYKEMGWYDWAAGGLVLLVEVGGDIVAPGASDVAAQALQAAHLSSYAYEAYGTCTGKPALIA